VWSLHAPIGKFSVWSKLFGRKKGSFGPLARLTNHASRHAPSALLQDMGVADGPVGFSRALGKVGACGLVYPLGSSK
jgi:hypothetical protein